MSTIASALYALKKIGIAEEEKAGDKPRICKTSFGKFNDEVLKIGGLPYGRVIQFWGPDHSGKTLLSIHSVACAQRENPDKIAIYIDTELTFDKAWAKALGVDLDRLVVLQGNDAEKELGDSLKAIESGVVCCMVIDSLGNLDEDSSSGSAVFDTKLVKGVSERVHKTIPGLFAKIMTSFNKKLIPAIKKHEVLFIATNHIRSKIGVLYGPTEDFPGGWSWKHNITLSLGCRKVGDIRDSKDLPPYGAIMAITVLKNKLAPAGKTNDESHLQFYFEGGMEKAETIGLFNEAITLDVITGGPLWFTVVDPETKKPGKKINGKAKILTALMEDGEFREQITKAIAYAKQQNPSGISEVSFEPVDDAETD